MRRVVILLALCSTIGAALKAQQPHTAASGAAKVQAGTLVFKSHCAVCHSVLPGATLVGPSLYGVMATPTGPSVRSIIINGKGRMRGLKDQLTSQEIADVLAYLKTLS